MCALQPTRVVLFGSSGKVGTAVNTVFNEHYTVFSINRSDCDVRELSKVKQVIEDYHPDIVINTVAFNGIDACENDPQQALSVNTLFPRLLADLSVSHDFLLVHFSSDAVFNGKSNDYYLEDSFASPINVYGLTKFGADCFISAIARRYYIARISLQFGSSAGNVQFVEKMLEKMRQGCNRLQISNDIIASPSYSLDVADMVKKLIENESSFGLYHIANDGMASLCEFMQEMADMMRFDVIIEPVPHSHFVSRGLKNTRTPIRSDKVQPMRHWRDALAEYCANLPHKKD